MIMIRIKKSGFSARKIREFGPIFKSGLVRMAKRWRDEMLPGHFRKGAAQKYGYEKRTPEYQKHKNRRGLGPLQYTGKAMRRILGDQREPSGSSKLVRLRLQSPGFFGRKYPGWKKTMADEVRAMTRKEADVLGNAALREIETIMNEESKTETLLYR